MTTSQSNEPVLDNEKTAAQKIVDIDAQLKFFEPNLQAVKEQQEALDAEIKAISESLHAKREEKRVAENAAYDLKREKHRLDRLREQAEKELAQQIANRIAHEEFLRLSVDMRDRIRHQPYADNALEHQITGAMQLAVAKRGILADAMGLGKTLTSLIYCDLVDAKKVLAVVPGDVCQNFAEEIGRWAPHRVVLLMNNRDKTTRNLVLEMAQKFEECIVIINYEAWRRDKTLIPSLIDCKFDTVIMDEAHNIKSRKTSAYKGLHKLVYAKNRCPQADCEAELILTSNYGVQYASCPDHPQAELDIHGRVNPLAYCSVQNTLPMTGTPIINKPQDLHALLSFVDPLRFTNERDFLATYARQNYAYKWVFTEGGLSRLVERIKGNYVARDRHSAGIVIPPQTEIIHRLTLDPEQYPEQFRVCQELNRYAAIALDSNTAVSILYLIELILRKRQAIVWPDGIVFKDSNGDVLYQLNTEESIKIDACVTRDGTGGLIPDLVGLNGSPATERVVVFSQFKEPLKELQKRLEALDISVARFDGDTPDDVREEIRRDFDLRSMPDEPKYKVLLANYKSGGVGLNFTGATQMIILDEEWSSAKRDQAYARTHRVGQTEETTVHVLRVDNSIDTFMADTIASKEAMIQGFDSEMNMAQMLKDAIDGGLI